MGTHYRRREFIATAAGGLAAAGLASTLPSGNPAWAAENLTVVEWGPPWIDASTRVLGNQDKWKIAWELHQGGAAAILPKIKSSWPNAPYDVVDCWTSVFLAMVREDWAETVTVADVPNLAHVPESLITRDGQGRWKNIPRSINFSFFVYRPDRCPIAIKTAEDLLDPRLKGQILWPSPTMHTCLHVVALALARGGDEYNIEPGWKFLQEIAKSGNIGRVYVTTSDTINSLTTGDTSVTFADQGTISAVPRNIPLAYLTRTHPSLKSFAAVEGWVVLRSSKRKRTAFDFCNFMCSPQASTQFNAEIRVPPASSKATPAKGIEHLVLTDEQLKKYVYIVDYDHVTKMLHAWLRRFEVEIQPFIT
jgi:putative spermidine/putrescine transport system substrate-binding protein